MKSPPPLVAAVAALLEELSQFERLATDLKDTPLRSKKHLERAGRSLQEIAASEDLLGGCVRDLDRAISESRVRHETLAAQVAAEAQRIEARTQVYQALVESVQAIGEQAVHLNAQFSAVAENADPASLAAASAELTTVWAAVRAVGERARADDFVDVARDVESLAQQLQAAHKKLDRVAPPLN